MITYEPGTTIVHRLDPRTKLGVQVCFALAIIATTDIPSLVILSTLTVFITGAAAVSIPTVLWELRYVLPFLIVPIAFEGVVFSPPWFDLAAVYSPLVASYRIVLLLIVSAVYVQTTPVRESRAAIQHVVPGKPGQFLGMGVAFVFRFVPVLHQDLTRTRRAIHTRLGTERPLTERLQLITIAGLSRAFQRSDRFSTALKARCFAWNPTLPELEFHRADVLGFGVGIILLLLVP